MLGADRARVVDLDAQILLLEHSPSGLPVQNAQAQARLDPYKYPVLTLPTEITSEIFINVLPVYPQYPTLAGLSSPTLLTQICRQWREIALGMSRLWRAITFDNYDIVPLEEQLHICRIWLTRSRSCPLAIRINRHGLEMSQVFEAITPHRERWEYLDLDLSPSNILAIEGPMPILRHLNLDMTDGLDRVITFAPAPLLRSIALSVITPLKLVLPLGQLTSLVFWAFRFEYVAILEQTCNLVHCELRIISGNHSGRPLEHAIELPCLKSLVLSLDTATPTTGYLDDFLVPGLRSLQLEELFLGPKPIDGLSEFISKSGCKLQEVCITNRALVSKASYREGFPSIPQFSFPSSWKPSA
ncbi:hypothetical protein K438DRAFT_1988542 [Mycena galopus ATCC 62051]|nr:hypothetical protein K438DRAFT_1988542 [Mycena galopus ATCC 62051]